jgi:uncharacterized membrane protein
MVVVVVVVVMMLVRTRAFGQDVVGPRPNLGLVRCRVVVVMDALAGLACAGGMLVVMMLLLLLLLLLLLARTRQQP